MKCSRRTSVIRYFGDNLNSSTRWNLVYGYDVLTFFFNIVVFLFLELIFFYDFGQN